MKNRVLLSLFSLAILPATTSAAIAQISSFIPSKPTEALASNFGKLALDFEVNQGQSDPHVKFISHGNGYSLFLTDSAAVLVLSPTNSSSSRAGHTSSSLHATKPVVGDVIRMELSGANANRHASGTEHLPGKVNYFIGNDSSKWRSEIPTYAKVRYENLYPGIDLVYYGNQRALEYDFVVSANADPKPLRLHFAGPQRLSLTPSGDLAIQARNGEIAFHKPIVYQLKDGVREPVEGRFQLVAGNSVRFVVGSYDHSRALVIDPVLAYSTYLGGSGGDSGNAVAVDASGNAYVVGGTTSIDFPVTANAFQKVNNGQFFHYGSAVDNAFITKFDRRGSVIYSTYLGGSTNDEEAVAFPPTGDAATAIAVDAAGNAYVTGYTSAYNFPVTADAFQTVNKGALTNMSAQPNAFVTKLDPTGSTLIYSTLLGGTGASEFGEKVAGDGGAGIAVDPSGSAYVVGNAASFDFPVTSGAFQQIKNATSVGSNLFITRFNPSGSALVYSTYLGGSGLAGDLFNMAESAGGIVIDSAGNAYVTGGSSSRDFPVTDNAYQKLNNSYYAGSNAVIAKLNPTGSALVYSTYLGGNFLDRGKSIARDAAGNVYVTGVTGSATFPTTPGAFQPVSPEPYPYTSGDAFVTELNPTGSALVYSTYLGGSQSDWGNAIALDAFGSAYITGLTYSADFPVTADAFHKGVHSPFGNAFVSKLDPTGSSLLYSSSLGGSIAESADYAGDTGNGIAVDWFGNAHITGQTCSLDFPLAGNPFQSVNKSNKCAAFFSKFIVNIVTGTRLVSNDNPVTAGSKVTFTATVTPNMGSTVPTGSVVFSLDGTPQVTVPLNASGQASYSNSTLTAGRHTITAVYSGSPTIAGSSANFGLTAIGEAARIGLVSGNNQTTNVNTSFPEPLVVQVQDANGVPVPGRVVTFTSSSGVSWSANPVLTDANGRASVTVTYDTGGSKTVTASADHVSIPATFRLNVNWSDRITIVSGNNQTTDVFSVFSKPLVVQVTNANGVPLPGQVVNFDGSGVSTAPNPTTSDANGRASVMAYSSDDPGPERVYVWTEHTPIWAVFDLTAIAPAP
jgi:hypothetical protein